MFDCLVAIRGGGDLGSGVALRLRRCGFSVVILETDHPVAVRRTVSFSEAVYDVEARVEEVVARRVDAPEGAAAVFQIGQIPVLVDPAAYSLSVLQPTVVVDAILAKRNLGTRRDMAPVVIALGPGFEAGRDVDAVVETNRGPHLGRVIWEGAAEPNTGQPGPVAGKTGSRVLRAPIGGVLRAAARIGDIVDEGDVVATVEDQPVPAAFRGLVRGLARDGLEVPVGLKIGDIDPRLDPELCRLVSDKALAVAGGVLEAMLSSDWEK